MNNTAKALLVSTFAVFMATSAMAVEYTKGVVKKVNTDAKKVTIIHEELKNLGMPAMTMVFRTKDDSMLATLNAGDKIEFVAGRLNGKLTVVELK